MVVFTCPGCSKNVQLLDDMLGSDAVCPYCKCLFVAPVRQADGSLSEPMLRRTNPFKKSRAFLPGILLLFIGGISFFWNGAQAIRYLSDPAAFEQQTRNDLAEMAEYVKQSNMKGKDPEDPVALKEAEERATDVRAKADLTITWLPRLRWACLAMGLATILGGIGMVRSRWHSMAMLGSVSAMFNILNLCCALGMPVGAWSLYILLNPAMRDQFLKSIPESKS